MKRVIVYCEGPTEETFVNRILVPALCSKNVFVSAHPCHGVSKYSIIRKDLSTLCKHDPTAIITTMLDYYALPSDTPGKSDLSFNSALDKVRHIEECIKLDIGVDNLIPNLTLHEFEALLFSNPECFSYCGLPRKVLNALHDIRASFETPEHINNSPNTAPSKRILALHPAYNKVLDGFNIAQDIGLDNIRMQCPHFNAWVTRLESLV